MPDELLIHPELEVTVPVLVAESAHRRLAADGPLAAYCTGGFRKVEAEDVVYLSTITGTTLVTSIEGVDVDRDGSSRQALVRTLLRHLVIDRVDPGTDTQRFLRTRAIGRIEKVMVQPTTLDPGGVGILEDDSDPPQPVTDQLERFQRMPPPRWISAEQLLVASAQSLWLSKIDFVTREYI